MHEQRDGCGVEEGACGVDGGLEVFCQPSIAPDPREEPLDDPAPRVNGEADLIGVLAHDLDDDQRCRGDLFPGISAVGEDALDGREDAPRDSQKRSAAVAVLDVAGCGSSTRPRPSVSTSAWRLRPLTFLPAS